MGRTALLAALLIAAAAVRLAGAAGTPASEDSLAVGLDLRGDPRRVERMARLLLADDPAVWRQAQVRLANAGPRALLALERADAIDDTKGRERVREPTKVALRLSVPPAELFRHDSLAALVREPIALAYAIAESLSARDYIWCQGTCGGMKSLYDGAPPPPPSATDRMVKLGGSAVPAAAAMLRDARPVARCYGLIVLDRLGVASVLDSIRALLGDGARVVEDQGDVSTGTTVADKARATLTNLRVVHQRPFAFEARATAAVNEVDLEPLISGLRTATHELAARGWNQWWGEAWPAWSQWWRLSGDGARPQDLEAFRDIVDGLDGCRVRIGPDPTGRAGLSITGPPGTACRVVLVQHPDSTLIASGPVPIHVDAEAKAESARESAAGQRSAIAAEGAMLVEATLPDGRRWRRMWAWQPDSRLQIELFARGRER